MKIKCSLCWNQNLLILPSYLETLLKSCVKNKKLVGKIQIIIIIIIIFYSSFKSQISRHGYICIITDRLKHL